MSKEKINENNEEVVAPSGFKIIAREIFNDKLALISLLILASIILFIFIASVMLDQEKIMKVSLLDRYSVPGEKFILGADGGGRSIAGQLIIGARNSLIIGIAVTALTTGIGLVIGLISGYYGGWIDNTIMRIIDFITMLPIIMIIMVFVIIVPKFNVLTFIFIMSIFYWTSIARLVRSKALSENGKDYVSASKTMGTSNTKIMFKEILPNISSIILVAGTLNLAGNIGIETGLSFLGFGLPVNTPSLGTLVSYAKSPEVIYGKLFVWLPASLLILVIMLCINYVGIAIRRAADSKQRLV